MDRLQSIFLGNSIPIDQHAFARTDLASNVNSVLVQSSTIYEEHNTSSLRNESEVDSTFSSSLTNEIRDALSEIVQSGSIWSDLDDGEGDGAFDSLFKDIIINGHLEIFANQIDSKSVEISLNASTILDRLDENFSLSKYSVSNIDTSFDIEEVWNVLQKDELSLLSYFNLSLGDEASWLHDIQEEASIIHSWEAEAEKLSRIAVAAFQNVKNGTLIIMENATLEALSTLEANANTLYHELQTRFLEEERAKKEKTTGASIEMQDDTWISGGFAIGESISHDLALATIKSMPLRCYKLRDDKQRDLAVNKNERRTRIHVGVIYRQNSLGNGTAIQFDTDEKKVEPSTIFSYNIGAVAQLANSFDQQLSKIRSMSSFFHEHSALQKKVMELKSKSSSSQSGFKSPSQLASEVAALETESTLRRITRLSLALVQSTQVHLVRARLLSRLKSLVTKEKSSERMSIIERDSASLRENHSENIQSDLDVVLIYFQAIDRIKSIWNSTKRELFEINNEANIESHVATEEIKAEATVERENENSSLEQIQIVGNARIEEIMAAVENIFWHLASCLHHIISSADGRRQFLFYIGASAALVFIASTMKEVISWGCFFILRFFTAPRLVREYGNLDMQVALSSKKHDRMSGIVLPQEIKERMESIVKVASSAASRRFPLRSVLVHGKSGSGKTMVAKALAESIPILPYALMSGADVFPMGNQGPAELRRLLTWASKNRNGGIIIIDEAESALGSRAKTRSDDNPINGFTANDKMTFSSGFSRDCLNVLLSMTGTFGNIMLILTTSCPSELDEAVLDRMDDIIHLPLPSERERCDLLRNAFSNMFEQEHKVSLFSHALSIICKPTIRTKFEENFSTDCLVELAKDSKTKGFSGRELEKIIRGVLHKACASDTGLLSNSLWERESKILCERFAEKHTLK